MFITYNEEATPELIKSGSLLQIKLTHSTNGIRFYRIIIRKEFMVLTRHQTTPPEGTNSIFTLINDGLEHSIEKYTPIFIDFNHGTCESLDIFPRLEIDPGDTLKKSIGKEFLGIMSFNLAEIRAEEIAKYFSEEIQIYMC